MWSLPTVVRSTRSLWCCNARAPLSAVRGAVNPSLCLATPSVAAPLVRCFATRSTPKSVLESAQRTFSASSGRNAATGGAISSSSTVDPSTLISVAEVLDRKRGMQVATIDQDQTAADAVREMIDNVVGGLLVTSKGKDGHQVVAGIITERDILKKCLVATDTGLTDKPSQADIDTAADAGRPAASAGAPAASAGASDAASDVELSGLEAELGRGSGIDSDLDVKPPSSESFKVTDNYQLSALQVRDIMTPAHDIICAKTNQSVHECVGLMLAKGVRHLPVVDKDSMVGMVSLRDFVGSVFKFTQEQVGVSEESLASKYVALFEKSNVLPANTKMGRDHKPPVALEFGRSALRSPDKKRSEDACFQLSYGQKKADQNVPMFSAFCVADGVGEWAKYGVDPAKFSQHLTRSAFSFLKGFVKENEKTRAPQDPQADRQGMAMLPSPAAAVRYGFEMCVDQKVVGASTICLAILDGRSSSLRWCNVGDSGFIILRPVEQAGTLFVGSNPEVAPNLQEDFASYAAGPDDTSDDGSGFLMEVVQRSPQKMIEFNMPAQLGFNMENKPYGENVQKLDHLRCDVREGDLIIMATDGVFDNLFEHDLLRIVGDGLGDVSTMAETIANAALDMSNNPERDGPFALLAKENNILWPHGGRKDDITVIVARVTLIGDGSEQADKVD